MAWQGPQQEKGRQATAYINTALCQHTQTLPKLLDTIHHVIHSSPAHSVLVTLAPLPSVSAPVPSSSRTLIPAFLLHGISSPLPLPLLKFHCMCEVSPGLFVGLNM